MSLVPYESNVFGSIAGHTGRISGMTDDRAEMAVSLDCDIFNGTVGDLVGINTAITENTAGLVAVIRKP